MPIAEALVAQVVAETSENMKDPAYAQLAVGDFVQAQKNVSQYLSSRAAKLGGGQQLVALLFHAQLARTCIARGRGSDVPQVTFPVLDRAAQGDAQKALSEKEPALASYIASNVDEPPLRAELCKVVLALVLAAESRGAGKRGG